MQCHKGNAWLFDPLHRTIFVHVCWYNGSRNAMAFVTTGWATAPACLPQFVVGHSVSHLGGAGAAQLRVSWPRAGGILLVGGWSPFLPGAMGRVRRENVFCPHARPTGRMLLGCAESRGSQVCEHNWGGALRTQQKMWRRKRWSDDRIYIISWMASVFANTVWNVGCVRRLEVPQTARNWIMECWGTVQLMHKLICSFPYSPVSLHRNWYGISVIDLPHSMLKYTTEVASLELPSYLRIITSHYPDPYEPVRISLFGSATASSWTMPKFPLLSRWSLSIFHFWRRYSV